MITATQPNGDEPIPACTPALLFEKLWNFLVDYAIKFTQDQTLAEDIVSEVFVKILNNRISFPHFEDGKAYLYVSVRNRCFDHLEYQKRLRQKNAGLSYLLTNLEANEIDILHRTDISDQHLRTVIAALPEKDQFFLECCMDNTLTMEAVAQKTGHTLNGAYYKKSVLLKYLRQELKRYLL